MFQCFRMSEKSVLMKVSLGKKIDFKEAQRNFALGWHLCGSCRAKLHYQEII